MLLRAGTSGFSFPAWKGTFYPERAPDTELLTHYAGRLATVELNNTFYRMPKSSVVVGWREQVPDSFRFVLKASRRITHQAKLRDVGDAVGYLYRAVQQLGSTFGAVLFQLPPFVRKDVTLLADFLAVLPPRAQGALEFRHPSWFTDDVYELLRQHGVALVGADTEEDGLTSPVVPTAPFGYLRLRDRAYTDAELSVWLERISAQGWSEVFVFFKHEEQGPFMAERLQALASGPGLVKSTSAQSAASKARQQTR